MDISSLGKTPIPGDSPCGENIRYEPEFEELQQEIDKLSSPSASGAVDWKKVEDASIAILSTRSKDLLVAGYLAVALLQNHREEGLVQGTHLILDLLENFWDDMFPPKKRAKGRLRIIEWWRDRTEALLERLAPLSFSAAEYDSLLKYLSDIDEFLAQNLKDAPSTMTIKRVLEKVASVKQEASPESGSMPEEDAGAAAGKAPGAPSPSASQDLASIEIESMEQFRKVLNSLRGGLRKAASFLRENEPSNPLGYRLWRAAIWLPVLDLPPADNGKTKIPGPQSQVVASLEDMAAKEDWKPLRDAAESRLAQFPFWLDLNYYTAKALRGMGEEYLRAAEVVEKETVSFVSLLPGIQRLAFADGRLFASQETTAWMDALVVLPDEERQPVQEAVGLSKTHDAVSDICADAGQAARSGDLAKAARLLQDGMDSGRSGRDRFRLMVCLLELFADTKNTTLLYAHCEEVLHDISRLKMEEWEPVLAFQGLQAVWRCYSKSRLTEKKKQANEVLMRMARINIPLAMSLIKE